MSNKISEIGQVLGSTARSNKYRLSFTWPRGVSGVTNLQEVDIICKAASAPGREIGVIEVWNQGRKLVIPGDTAFDNSWSVSFYATENHSIRYDMVKWQVACDNFHQNIHSGQPYMIFADLKLEQLDSAGNVSAQYTLHNCFPTSVGEISYGDDSADTPVEFDITLSYTDWVLGSGEEDEWKPLSATRNPTGLTS